MKKLLLFAAGAAIMFTSCMKTEVTETERMTADNAIGFGAYTAQATRGAEATLPTVRENGMGVTATMSGTQTFEAANAITPNFMFNQQVSYGTAWTYSPVKYWPETLVAGDNTSYGKVSFFAYSPYEDGDNNTGIVLSADKTGYPTLTFTTKQAAKDQIDLLTDEVDNKTKLDQGNPVKFTFNHALSRIAFSAKLDQALLDEADMTIKSVKVYYSNDKVAQVGTYTYNGENNKGTWDETSNFVTAGATVGISAGDILAGTGATEVVATDYVAFANTTAVSLTKSDKYLMLIPQSIDEGDIYVDVQYTATYNDKLGTTENDVRVKLPAVDFKMGRAYNFIMVFSPLGIVFDVEAVDSWESNGPVTNVETVATVVAAQATIAAAFTTNNTESVGVAVSEEVAASAELVVPAPAAEAQAPASISINLQNGIAADQTLTVKDAAGAAYEGEVHITTPAGSEGNVTVDMPKATVYINGVITKLIVATAPNTTVINKDAEVGTLVVEKGNVEVYGKVGSVERTTDNADSFTVVSIFTGGTLTTTLTDSQIVVKNVTSGQIKNITTGKSYATVNDAVEAASEGDVIELTEGIYDLGTPTRPDVSGPDGYYLKIDKSITLKGIGNVKIFTSHHAPQNRGGMWSLQNLVTVMAEDVTLQNITFEANYNEYYEGPNKTIEVYSNLGDGFVMDGCTIIKGSSSDDAGCLYIGGDGENTLKATVKNSTFNSSAIGVRPNTTTEISNCKFNVIRPYWESSISVRGKASVSDCVFVCNTEEFAIDAKGTGSIVVNNCTFPATDKVYWYAYNNSAITVNGIEYSSLIKGGIKCYWNGASLTDINPQYANYPVAQLEYSVGKQVVGFRRIGVRNGNGQWNNASEEDLINTVKNEKMRAVIPEELNMIIYGYGWDIDMALITVAVDAKGNNVNPIVQTFKFDKTLANTNISEFPECK